MLHEATTAMERTLGGELSSKRSSNAPYAQKRIAGVSRYDASNPLKFAPYAL
jgi:hypothetical protein